MCILYTYTNTYMLRFSPSGFSRPSRCPVLTLGLAFDYHMCSVCVCVRIDHLHSHTLPPASKNRKDTDNRDTSLSPSVKNNTPRQAILKCFPQTSSTSPPSPPNANEQSAHKAAHVHTLQQVSSKLRTLISKTPA